MLAFGRNSVFFQMASVDCFLLIQNTLSVYLIDLVLVSKAVLVAHRLVVLDVSFVSVGDLNSHLCHLVYFFL